jgi:adenosylcobinamide-phosphate synthase
MEAAFAGALGARLGGTLAYEGRTEARPSIGDGAPPKMADIARATRLSSVVGVASLALFGGLAAWRSR